MDQVPGTKGYAGVTQAFITATLAIDFGILHRDFVPFFPVTKGRVLDIGAGIGRDAAALAQMGHSVVAIEPADAFRAAGKELYGSTDIEWIDDALPGLSLLADTKPFDLVLASGVWHHLSNEEQQLALHRIAGLLKVNGIFALSLRNGPAGAGTHIFPTNATQTIQEAGHCGLSNLLCLKDQPSLMQNKEQVTWTKLVFRKQE